MSIYICGHLQSKVFEQSETSKNSYRIAVSGAFDVDRSARLTNVGNVFFLLLVIKLTTLDYRRCLRRCCGGGGGGIHASRLSFEARFVAIPKRPQVLNRPTEISTNTTFLTQ